MHDVIKQEGKNVKRRFYITILISAAIGGCFGLLISSISLNTTLESRNHFLKLIDLFFEQAIPYIFIIFSIITIFYVLFLQHKVKSEFQNLSEEDDVKIQSIENRVNTALMLSNIIYIISFMLIGIVTSDLFYNGNLFKHSFLITFVVCFLFFVFNLIIVIRVQKNLIHLIKKMNPEKKGNVYDINFHKDWLNSCDEAQQLMIYKCAYKSFQTMGRVFTNLMLFFFLVSILYHSAIFLMILTTFFWLLMNITYSLESMKCKP